MNNLKILENACTAAIELADNCADCDAKTQGYIYHLVKFVRAEIRDFPEKTDKLNESFELLGKYANRLKKSAGDRLSKFIIAGSHGETISLPINNIQGSLIHVIRQNLKEKNACNYLHIHKISNLMFTAFLSTGQGLMMIPILLKSLFSALCLMLIVWSLCTIFAGLKVP